MWYGQAVKLPNPKIARIAAIIFLGVASLGAGYLLLRSLQDGPVAGCGGAGSPCDSVLKSRWAYVLPGVPVTAPALASYLVLLFALIFRPRDEITRKSKLRTLKSLAIGPYASIREPSQLRRFCRDGRS